MFTIRSAKSTDIVRMAEIEALCFSVAEAASLTSFKQRFAVFPECYFVLEVDELVVGHVNGCIYHSPELPDALYADPTLHCSDGKYQTVFGLAVDPKFQGNGYAFALMEHFVHFSYRLGHEGMVLTCKDHLVSFYQRLGFVHQGVSKSSHGGAQWNDMLLKHAR